MAQERLIAERLARLEEERRRRLDIQPVNVFTLPSDAPPDERERLLADLLQLEKAWEKPLEQRSVLGRVKHRVQAWDTERRRVAAAENSAVATEEAQVAKEEAREADQEDLSSKTSAELLELLAELRIPAPMSVAARTRAALAEDRESALRSSVDAAKLDPAGDWGSREGAWTSEQRAERQAEVDAEVRKEAMALIVQRRAEDRRDRKLVARLKREAERAGQEKGKGEEQEDELPVKEEDITAFGKGKTYDRKRRDARSSKRAMLELLAAEKKLDNVLKKFDGGKLATTAPAAEEGNAVGVAGAAGDEVAVSAGGAVAGEALRFAEIFRVLDRNSNGVVTPREIILALRKRPELAAELHLAAETHEGASRDRLMEYFHELDKNQDDEVTMQEFVDFH
ncbi:hypothetical protein TeGR_g3229, partial [Tetraparma gracilis]